MPRRLKRYYGRSDLHFITFSCYCRLPALVSSEHRTLFVRTLEKLRTRYGFALVGYVVMPEHVHMLMSEPQIGNPSKVMQVLKQCVSRRILKELRAARPGSTGDRLLKALAPQGGKSKSRLWQRRFYDFNVWSEKKKWEKLEYMRLNPVKRSLVRHPGHWPWSSFRFHS